ncbi:hypothetical protein ACHAXT_012065 [Thalassiosira profunda]
MKLSSTLNLLLASAALLASTPSADAAERKLRGRHRNTKGAVNSTVAGGPSSVLIPIADEQEATQQRRKLARCSGVCTRPAECPANLHTLKLPACSNAAIGELCLGDGECARDDLDNCSYRILGGSATVDRSVYVRYDCKDLTDSAFDIPRPTPPPTSPPTPPPTPPPKPPKQTPCGHAGYPPCGEVGGAQKQQPPTEPAWAPGTLCGAGTTCENCKDGYYEFWDSLFFTACGREPCWPDGDICAAGTTCNNCCNSYHWSLDHFFTVCGV